MTSPALRSAPPSPVSLAQKLMYALAALSVINTLLTLTQRDAIRDMAPEGIDADTFGSGAIAGSIIFTVISVVLWVLLGVFTGRGKNWARIVATVLAALGLLSSLTTFGSDSSTTANVVIAVIQVIIFIALIVLLWRKESSAYFKAGGAPRQTVADPGYPTV